MMQTEMWQNLIGLRDFLNEEYKGMSNPQLPTEARQFYKPTLEGMRPCINALNSCISNKAQESSDVLYKLKGIEIFLREHLLRFGHLEQSKDEECRERYKKYTLYEDSIRDLINFLETGIVQS